MRKYHGSPSIDEDNGKRLTRWYQDNFIHLAGDSLYEEFFFFYLILVLKSNNVFAWQMCSLYTGIIIIRNKTKCLEQSSCCLTKMCSFGKHHNSLVFRAENARVSGL